MQTSDAPQIAASQSVTYRIQFRSVRFGTRPRFQTRWTPLLFATIGVPAWVDTEQVCEVPTKFFESHTEEQSNKDDCIPDLMRDFHDYLEEIDEDRALCAKHAETAAIHDMEGQNLELYRMFKATANAAEHLRTGAKHLPDWEESLFAKHNIEGWEKLRQQVTQRMEKHGKQHEVLTKGVAWEGRPVLIHAYKFEPDPRMKVELIVPPYGDPSPMLPIQTLAVLLRCHEFLLAPGIVAALPPYVGHDVKFMTLWEYLEAKMPKDEYAIFSLPTYQNVAPSA